MEKIIVGMADSYGTAESIVEDLELAGIVGNQVEVITDLDDEVTGFEGKEGQAPREGFVERIRQFFHSHSRAEKNVAHDYYVEDPESYVSKVREGRSLVIVRLPDGMEGDRAVEILRGYGAVDPHVLEKPTARIRASSERG
jgi:hypothetical protein